MYDLSGKVALVTGAGGRRGMGRAIATRLASEGADVVVTDIMKPPHPDDAEHDWHGIDSVVAEIEAMGRRAIGLFSDITDASQVREMVERTVNNLGKIDIFVANAGSEPGGDRRLIMEVEDDAFDLVQRVNVKGTFMCLREVSRHMVERGGPGKIITISSRAGKQGTARYGPYCASKFAIIGLTETLALELAPYKINVNAICPGLVDTERVYHIADALRPEDMSADEYRKQMLEDRGHVIPLGRAAVATDISNTAAFLASDQSDYLTGLSISVSGGLGMN